MSASITINNTTGAGVTVISPITLNSLTDVTIASVDDEDRLVYDEATGTWVNEIKAASGGDIDGGDFT